MEYVGGYSDYLLLLEDELAFDDVMAVLAGQSEADTTRQLEADLASGSW